MNQGAPPTGAMVWWAGARPRTLGAAVVPVLVGTAAAGDASPLRTLGCFVVALGLQIGINYLNDWADAVRGVDTPDRVGPLRITAAGLASPRAVLGAALAAFLAAGVAGLLLAAATSWWLLLVGAASLIGAATYSAGPVPYGARGLGEVAVLVFFGLVAVAGTAYVQAGTIGPEAWWSAASVGLFAVAILVANNIRDIPTDAAAGKRTLAVRIGETGARTLHRAMLVGGFIVPVAGVAAGGLPGSALLILTAAPMAAGPFIAVGSAHGPEFIRVLFGTAMTHLQAGVMLAIGLWFG